MTTFEIQGLPLVSSGRLLRIVGIPEGEEDYYDVDNPEELVAALRRVRPRLDILSFWQRLPDTDPKFSYHLEWDNIAAVPIESFDSWFSQTVHPSVRTKVRKAEKKGICVAQEEFSESLVDGMLKIFNEVEYRQGRPYEHFGKTHQEVSSEWSVDLDKSLFITARLQGELVGFVKATYTERYAELSGTVCMLKHRDKSPMNALIAGAVKMCADLQIPYLTYGKYIYNNKGEDSLASFKKYNGFECVTLPRYFVPLTFTGKIAVSLGLHRKLSERLPRKLLLKLLAVRSKLYMLRESS